MPRVSIVIPTLNEAETIGAVIRELPRGLRDGRHRRRRRLDRWHAGRRQGRRSTGHRRGTRLWARLRDGCGGGRSGERRHRLPGRRRRGPRRPPGRRSPVRSSPARRISSSPPAPAAGANRARCSGIRCSRVGSPAPASAWPTASRYSDMCAFRAIDRAGAAAARAPGDGLRLEPRDADPGRPGAPAHPRGPAALPAPAAGSSKVAGSLRGTLRAAARHRHDMPARRREPDAGPVSTAIRTRHGCGHDRCAVDLPGGRAVGRPRGPGLAAVRDPSPWRRTCPAGPPCTHHDLASSDSETLSLSSLLALAQADDLERWDKLSLGYTDPRGAPWLRAAIAAAPCRIDRQAVVVLVPAPRRPCPASARALLAPTTTRSSVVPIYRPSERP